MAKLSKSVTNLWVSKLLALIVGALCLLSSNAASALDKVKVGSAPTSYLGILYAGIERGYFKDEGIEVEYVNFDAGQPVAVAAASGDIDIGMAGFTAALYNFTGQGILRIIGGGTNNHTGFRSMVAIASNSAHASGLKSFSDLNNRSVALTTAGSTFHYATYLLSEKYKSDMKTMQSVPLGSMGNVGSAITGGKVDWGIITANVGGALLNEDKVKLLGWISEEVPFQVSLTWTSAKVADSKSDLLKRFLRAFQKGRDDYVAAFIDSNGLRKDGPTAPAMYELLSRILKASVDQVKEQISYIDPQGRVDIDDVKRQIDWYKSQGMLQGSFDMSKIIDARYVIPMPSSPK